MKLKIMIGVFVSFLLTACQTGLIDANHNEISVKSEPSGASVYVMGELVGVTPIKVNVTKLYPVTYEKENQQHYGRIVLKHEGCSDRVVKVTHDISGTGLNEKLECTSDIDVAEKPVVIGKTVKQRLHELQALKEGGLVNEEEYQKLRIRILESL